MFVSILEFASCLDNNFVCGHIGHRIHLFISRSFFPLNNSAKQQLPVLLN